MFNLLAKTKFVDDSSASGVHVTPDAHHPVVPLHKVEVVSNKKQEIDHSEELPPFERKLYDLISMAPSTRHAVCPIDIGFGDDKKPRFAIICLRSQVNSDITREVVKQLLARGYVKAEPFSYVAAQAVMVELARDAINEVKKSAAKQTDAFIGKNANSALWQMFESIVLFAMENDASDIHFEIEQAQPNSQIRFRVDGRLTAPRQFNLDSHDVLDTIAYMYNIHGKSGSENTYNQNKPQQCQIQSLINGRRLLFRWASNQTAKGTKVVLRMLYQDETATTRSLDELGYLPLQVRIWERTIKQLGGATLVAGVVGSGKSTTMQTVMTMCEPWMAKYTVEDPVEYLMPGVAQFSVSRTLSEQDTDPFMAVKRQLKRMDPDVVLVGEIRDQESAALLRNIAESGHRAFATIHAPSALDMLTLRLVSEEVGIPRGVLATPGFINLLVYQALVPKLCPHCNKPAHEVHSPDYLDRIHRLFKLDTQRLRAKNTDGCTVCRREDIPELNGVRGRLVVAEMIELDSQMLHMFREGLNMELKEYIRMQREAGYDEPDSTGKNALEVAMYHVAHGIFDPADVEMKFGTFEQFEKTTRG